MGQPLVSAITGNQAIWRPVGVLLLLLGVMLRTGPALAEEQSEGFSVRGFGFLQLAAIMEHVTEVIKDSPHQRILA